MAWARTLRHGFYRLSRVYRRFFTPVTLGCRALVMHEGQVLLVRHSYQDGWYLPGGKVDRGESLHTAVRRELKEECGLVAHDATLLRMYYSENEGRSDHIALFVVSAFVRLPDAPLDAEIAETGFFGLSELPAATSPATRRRLAEALLGQVPAERW